MLEYYMQSAFRKSMNQPWLTASLILIIGLGVAACMTTLSVLRAATRDPVPNLSQSLYAPSLTSTGEAGSTFATSTGLVDHGTAERLLAVNRGAVFADYALNGIVLPQQPGQHPLSIDGHAVSTALFPILDVPFIFGSPWSPAEENNRDRLIVISRRLNDEIFSGHNSVGQTLNYNGTIFRIVGVINDWDLSPRFYDVNNGNGYPGTNEDFLIPLESALANQMSSSGAVSCVERPDSSGFNALLNSNCLWISLIAKAPMRTDLQALNETLRVSTGNLATNGHAAGKVSGSMISLRSLLESKHIVPDGTRSSVAVSLALFLGCLITAASLMMSNYLGRASEVGLRRALGARKIDIIGQLLIESGVVGILGGIVGIILTFLGVSIVHRLLPSGPAQLTTLQIDSICLALLGALLATIIAGIYPAVSASRAVLFSAIKQG